MSQHSVTVTLDVFNAAWEALALPANAVSGTSASMQQANIKQLWEKDGILLKELNTGERIIQTFLGVPFGMAVLRPMSTTVELFGKLKDFGNRLASIIQRKTSPQQ